MSDFFIVSWTFWCCAIRLWTLFNWRSKWQPTPVLLPGKLHGWRSLVGYSPWGHKELDTIERLHFLSFYSSFWRRKWQPTPVFLPGESHGQRGPVGYSLWGCKELDMTKQLTHTHTHTHTLFKSSVLSVSFKKRLMLRTDGYCLIIFKILVCFLVGETTIFFFFF